MELALLTDIRCCGCPLSILSSFGYVFHVFRGALTAQCGLAGTDPPSCSRGWVQQWIDQDCSQWSVQEQSCDPIGTLRTSPKTSVWAAGRAMLKAYRSEFSVSYLVTLWIEAHHRRSKLNIEESLGVELNIKTIHFLVTLLLAFDQPCPKLALSLNFSRINRSNFHEPLFSFPFPLSQFEFLLS